MAAGRWHHIVCSKRARTIRRAAPANRLTQNVKRLSLMVKQGFFMKVERRRREAGSSSRICINGESEELVVGET